MSGMKKTAEEKPLDQAIKTLDWRRSMLWREIGRRQSGLPGEKERSDAKVERLQEELEKDFKQAYRILASTKIWGSVILFSFFATIPSAWAGGVVSQSFDAAGEILAFPFHVVGELFRFVF